MDATQYQSLFNYLTIPPRKKYLPLCAQPRFQVRKSCSVRDKWDGDVQTNMTVLLKQFDEKEQLRIIQELTEDSCAHPEEVASSTIVPSRCVDKEVKRVLEKFTVHQIRFCLFVLAETFYQYWILIKPDNASIKECRLWDPYTDENGDFQYYVDIDFDFDEVEKSFKIISEQVDNPDDPELDAIVEGLTRHKDVLLDPINAIDASDSFLYVYIQVLQIYTNNELTLDDIVFGSCTCLSCASECRFDSFFPQTKEMNEFELSLLLLDAWMSECKRRMAFVLKEGQDLE